MFSVIEEKIIGGKRYIKSVALAADTLPTATDLANGSSCTIMNAGTTYYYDGQNGEWVEYAAVQNVVENAG